MPIPKIEISFVELQILAMAHLDFVEDLSFENLATFQGVLDSLSSVPYSAMRLALAELLNDQLITFYDAKGQAVQALSALKPEYKLSIRRKGVEKIAATPDGVLNSVEKALRVSGAWTPRDANAAARRLATEERQALEATGEEVDPEPPEELVPASDRVVRLDDNAAAYDAFVGDLVAIREALPKEAANYNLSAEEVVDLERQLDDAVRVVRASPVIQLDVLVRIVQAPIKYLADRAISGVVGELAFRALEFIARHLG